VDSFLALSEGSLDTPLLQSFFLRPCYGKGSWGMCTPLASTQTLGMSSRASVGYLPATHKMPPTTEVLCRKLLPDLPGPVLSSPAGLASLEAMTAERNCFSRGGWKPWQGTSKQGCTGLWLPVHS
jgi:hypothetical protein